MTSGRSSLVELRGEGRGVRPSLTGCDCTGRAGIDAGGWRVRRVLWPGSGSGFGLTLEGVGV